MQRCVSKRIGFYHPCYFVSQPIVFLPEKCDLVCFEFQVDVKLPIEPCSDQQREYDDTEAKGQWRLRHRLPLHPPPEVRSIIVHASPVKGF